MKKVLFICIAISFSLLSCVHEAATSVPAVEGSSINPKFAADSATSLSSGTGSTGPTAKTDTPKQLTIPNTQDTSQKKNLNPPH